MFGKILQFRELFAFLSLQIFSERSTCYILVYKAEKRKKKVFMGNRKIKFLFGIKTADEKFLCLWMHASAGTSWKYHIWFVYSATLKVIVLCFWNKFSFFGDITQSKNQAVFIRPCLFFPCGLTLKHFEFLHIAGFRDIFYYLKIRLIMMITWQLLKVNTFR